MNDMNELATKEDINKLMYLVNESKGFSKLEIVLMATVSIFVVLMGVGYIVN